MNITENRKAYHNYFIEDKYEAGISLQGWEVKAIKQNRVQLQESYIIIRNSEIFIVGMHISPLHTASKITDIDPKRNRKMLLKAKEINKLIGKVDQKGYSLVPLNLHFKNNLIKVEFALGKGKKSYDKRESLKNKEWNREKERLFKFSR
ncbi:SsrA-binding protein [Candidatus Kinetoplastibacterium sorsogonicusi]|uniref:SsrA-binding protein n=1 Tax=Candidatus Kinetoplastidibacterium kentomonadis TaxID=1576550 RepID=A0A3S7J9T3_9PROT|nr:SsrA-binding protein SmpB [Candidatus Kinetoplastibacterium sorsogonicusi]AWD32437.1 SsrA-binding protein [Candidatus Kinetoplastibacterium sorsogonicusi]